MDSHGRVVILVVTHKMFDDSILPQKGGYKVIAVGNQLHNRNENWIADNTGDNISAENGYYCELTAQYWGWKNLDNQNIKYMGISHYRRYFFDYNKESECFKDDILSEDRIVEILGKYKIILPFYKAKNPGDSILYKNVPKEKQDKHWVLLEGIINEHFIEYVDDFYKIIYGEYIVWGNMFITSKKYFDEYSKWLFSLLRYYDEYIEKQNEQRIDRVDGYLSEALLLVWVNHNFRKEDIYNLEVRNIESDPFLEYSKQGGVKNRLKRIIRTHRTFLILYQKLGLYYVLWKRCITKAFNII